MWGLLTRREGGSEKQGINSSTLKPRRKHIKRNCLKLKKTYSTRGISSALGGRLENERGYTKHAGVSHFHPKEKGEPQEFLQRGKIRNFSTGGGRNARTHSARGHHRPGVTSMQVAQKQGGVKKTWGGN